MSKARSYKNQPWTSFEKQSYSVLKDDFVHEKVLTVKANIQSTNGGFNIKEVLNQKGESLASTGEAKLWFYVKNNRSLYAKILPQALTLSYDHGVNEVNNRSFNWYGGVETNRNLNNNHWHLGLDVFSPNGDWACNNKLQFSQNDKSLQWLHKAFGTKKQWFWNNYHTVDLTGKAFQQSAFLLAFRQKGERNNDYSARFELDGFANADELKRSLWEGNKLTLNWVNSQKGNYAHGVEFSSHLNRLSLNPSDILRNLATAFEVSLPEQNSTFKLRLSGHWAAAVSLKHKLGNYGTYVWGAEISDLGSKNNIRFGVQIDLNL